MQVGPGGGGGGENTSQSWAGLVLWPRKPSECSVAPLQCPGDFPGDCQERQQSLLFVREVITILSKAFFSDYSVEYTLCPNVVSCEC